MTTSQATQQHASSAAATAVAGTATGVAQTSVVSSVDLPKVSVNSLTSLADFERYASQLAKQAEAFKKGNGRVSQDLLRQDSSLLLLKAERQQQHLDKQHLQWAIQPRIHFPYKLGKPPPPAPKPRVPYEPPPVGLTLPQPTIDTHKLQKRKTYNPGQSVVEVRRRIQMHGDIFGMQKMQKSLPQGLPALHTISEEQVLQQRVSSPPPGGVGAQVVSASAAGTYAFAASGRGSEQKAASSSSQAGAARTSFRAASPPGALGSLSGAGATAVPRGATPSPSSGTSAISGPSSTTVVSLNGFAQQQQADSRGRGLMQALTPNHGLRFQSPPELGSRQEFVRGRSAVQKHVGVRQLMAAQSRPGITVSYKLDLPSGIVASRTTSSSSGDEVTRRFLVGKRVVRRAYRLGEQGLGKPRGIAEGESQSADVEKSGNAAGSAEAGREDGRSGAPLAEQHHDATSPSASPSNAQASLLTQQDGALLADEGATTEFQFVDLQDIDASDFQLIAHLRRNSHSRENLSALAQVSDDDGISVSSSSLLSFSSGQQLSATSGQLMEEAGPRFDNRVPKTRGRKRYRRSLAHGTAGGSGCSRRSNSVPLDKHASKDLEFFDLLDQPLQLADLPEELLYQIFEFLPHADTFRVCVASSRRLPHVWGVVLLSFSRALAEIQQHCEDCGVLTDIASSRQHSSQALWQERIAERRMMLEDARRFERNGPRYELELAELLDLENDAMAAFQAAVQVLADVMNKWSALCRERDDTAKMVAGFHAAIGVTFSMT